MTGAKRLNLDNVRPAVRDASVFKSDMEFMMDAVLVDAPCSGLGVMINKPDVKYRYKDEQIDELVQLQRKILSACARYVKVGGTLVYSTCTVFAEENEDNVKRFVAAHSDFSLVPFTVGDVHAPHGMLTLLPHIHDTDGFFIAKLQRKDIP
jgi:16S rRNA (cytosine967-C5)-methyltransferase